MLNWTTIGKGLRTVSVGLAIAILPAAHNYVAGIDWADFGVSPTAGVVIGAIVIGLRTITNTPVATK